MIVRLPAAVDVVIVGAGTAGCVLASRLARGGDRSVLLLDQGPGTVPGTEATALSVLPFSDLERTIRWPERRGRPVVRGRGLGGSSVINGGYFLRGHRSDFAEWPAWWTQARVAQAYDAVESALQVSAFSDDELGDVSRAFEDYWGTASERSPVVGQAWPADGLLRVRSNHAGGHRVPAGAVLVPLPDAVSLRGGVRVDEVLHVDGRVTGVRVGDAVVRAETVILSAGTLGTAALLEQSGVLRAIGLEALAPQEHAERIVRFTPRRRVVAPAILQSVWHTADGLEIRCYGDDFARFIAGLEPSGVPIGVADFARPAVGSWSSGQVDLGEPEAATLERLDSGAARVIEMLRSAAFEELVEPGSIRVDPTVSMSQHAYGTLPLGRTLDELGGVPGIAGLRVVDGSVLPAGLRSGPHATIAMVAWAIGEAI